MARAKAKRKSTRRRTTKVPAKKTRIPKALRTEAKRLRQRGRIPQRLIDSLPQDAIDELFPDLDESELYD